MPIDEWTRVPSGLFHHFHQDWTIQITRTLNQGRLPKGLSALVEQRSRPKESDILTVGKGLYAARANRIVVRHHLGRIVAVIEIVSPDNKDSRAALREFVDKAVEFLHQGIHLLVVDLFPPTPRDPAGIHKMIWDEFIEEDFRFPPGKNRILVSYATDGERTAYIEPVAIGDVLPDMPLFLAAGKHIPVPLEPTYQSTWDASPEELRKAVQTGIMPHPDAEGEGD